MNKKRNEVEDPPVCCGEAMIRNGPVYECADAYFYLDVERLLGDCGDLIEWRRPITEYERGRYRHWRDSFRPVDPPESVDSAQSSRGETT